ncbi:hypothetical protein A2U01_0050663, partial [Trifolium medium]|nr:hypothetical protein [Trifolium medium]
ISRVGGALAAHGRTIFTLDGSFNPFWVFCPPSATPWWFSPPSLSFTSSVGLIRIGVASMVLWGCLCVLTVVVAVHCCC